MKSNTLLVKAFFASATVAVLLLPAAPLSATDAEECDACHRYSGLGRIDESGKKRLFYVNLDSYTHSVHGKLRCTGCHADIKSFPHADAQKVDCAIECHIVEPSVERKFTHARMVKDYENSVHGKYSQGTIKEHAEDLPTCTYCHQNRIPEPVQLEERQWEAIAQETLVRCLGCHEDEQWTRYYYTHLTHRLKRLRTSVNIVDLCSSCHEDKNKMERHGLETTGAFRDTFHWQAIKYGDPNAPNCIDCHAPMGYSSHTIMPRDNPRSAIYKDNLVHTCSNPTGLRECHPAATPAFARGNIHPSGVKAELFDLNLAKHEKQQLIKKGELKPFTSLMQKKAQEQLTPSDYYQHLALRFIRYFYMLVIGCFISFMLLHQLLDFLASRRDANARNAADE